MTSPLPQTFASPAADIVRVVDQPDRQSTGKARRFRPLEAVEVSRPA
jgi:hypothetical protein